MLPKPPSKSKSGTIGSVGSSEQAPDLDLEGGLCVALKVSVSVYGTFKCCPGRGRNKFRMFEVVFQLKKYCLSWAVLG